MCLWRQVVISPAFTILKTETLNGFFINKKLFFYLVSLLLPHLIIVLLRIEPLVLYTNSVRDKSTSNFASPVHHPSWQKHNNYPYNKIVCTIDPFYQTVRSPIDLITTTTPLACDAAKVQSTTSLDHQFCSILYQALNHNRCCRASEQMKWVGYMYEI